jgi:hypothetical protein
MNDLAPKMTDLSVSVLVAWEEEVPLSRAP